MGNRIELITEKVDGHEMVIGLRIGDVEVSADVLESLAGMLSGHIVELLEDYTAIHTRVLRDMAQDGVYDQDIDHMLEYVGSIITNHCISKAA